VLSLAISLDSLAGPANIYAQEQATYRIVRERLQGYAAACEAAGLPWSAIHVEVCIDNTLESGEAAANRLLDAAPNCTAILAMSDLLAIGAMRAAASRGLAIPQDLSLVGFDDIPSAVHTSPPLTTVWQPHEEKGRLAGQMLLARLQGDAEHEVSRHRLATRLVLRSSTAPPRE
jgi:DNA-binding LacI/PurR family transcriptional regulator